MRGFFGSVRRLFGGEAAPAHGETVVVGMPQRLLAISVLLVLLAFVAQEVVREYHAHQAETTAHRATPVQVARRVLIQNAALLRDAVKTGDVAQAGVVTRQIGDLLQDLNTQESALPALRSCLLAAGHIAHGAEAMHQGFMYWPREPQFIAALERCQ